MKVTIEEAQSTLPELLDLRTAGEEVVITRNDLSVARLVRPLDEAAPPRRVRIVGTLNGVEPDDRSFTLKLANGQEVHGRLENDSFDELVGHLNRLVLVDGIAIFQPDDLLLRLDAAAFRPATEGDAFFNKMPKPARPPRNLAEMGRQNAVVLREIFGKWPGDESDEQIDAALREMS